MRTPDPRTLINFAVLLAGAVVTSLILLGTGDDDQRDRRPVLSLAYYLDRAELAGTGPDGELLYQVWTQRAAQSLTDESISLNQVRMKYAAPNTLPWDLKANSGRIPANASIIELRGNVIAVSEDDEDKVTIIRTQQLDIDPATREATTDRKVVVEFDGRRLNATGMLANLETNRLELLSNVNGKFNP